MRTSASPIRSDRVTPPDHRALSSMRAVVRRGREEAPMSEHEAPPPVLGPHAAPEVDDAPTIDPPEPSPPVDAEPVRRPRPCTASQRHLRDGRAGRRGRGGRDEGTRERRPGQAGLTAPACRREFSSRRQHGAGDRLRTLRVRRVWVVAADRATPAARTTAARRSSEPATHRDGRGDGGTSRASTSSTDTSHRRPPSDQCGERGTGPGDGCTPRTHIPDRAAPAPAASPPGRRRRAAPRRAAPSGCRAPSARSRHRRRSDGPRPG